MTCLLAVDLGLRTGLAAYGHDGRLIWYRSHHYANRGALRRGLRGVLDACPGLTWIVLEGGGPLADAWRSEAVRRGMEVLQVAAEEWREALLLPRERRGGDRSKHSADALARQIIERSGAGKPTSLRHDAAEAVLIGHWAVRRLGWLDEPGTSFLRP